MVTILASHFPLKDSPDTVSKPPPVYPEASRKGKLLVKGGLYYYLNSTPPPYQYLSSPQHEVAAGTLVEIGGVEFLSQLRLHCDSSLHFFIDETLEHLLKLPHHLFPTAGPSSPLPYTIHPITKTPATEHLCKCI